MENCIQSFDETFDIFEMFSLIKTHLGYSKIFIKSKKILKMS